MEKPCVLLAEDNESTSTLVRAVLRPHFDVDAVMDGAEAIEKLRARRYAAIVLDLLMPVADGFAVLDYLAAERPEVLRRVVVVTAAMWAREQDRLSAYPIAAVIGKPFEVGALIAAVRACAGEDDDAFPHSAFLSSGMLFLLADLLRH